MGDSEAKQVSASGDVGSGATSAAEINVAVGDVLAGKFRVERVLGAGGMGVVVEARDVDLDERVAIKLLLPAALERPDVVARFRREARAAVKIKSEHIARVIDVGSLEDGAPYIVMEYLEGYDLSKPIRNGGKLPITLAVDYILQASEAIAEAHTMGVVHRDIKPPNLFLTLRADGSACIKVLDFGISKVVGALDAEGSDTPEVTLTQTSVVLGSPRYMAPEQISKPKSVDARADIWGIGTTFYRMVTGVAPFEGNSLPEIFAAILMTPNGPTAIHERVPDAPAELDAVIRRCMRINPDERWQNLGELATALAPFGSGAGKRSAERIRGILESAGISSNSRAVSPSITPPSPASTSGAAMVNTLDTSVSLDTDFRKRNTAGYVVAAVAGVVVIGLGIVFFAMDGSEPAKVAAAGPSATAAASASIAAPAMPSIAVLPSTAAPSASASTKPATVKRTVGPAKPKTTADPGGDGEELFDQRN